MIYSNLRRYNAKGQRIALFAELKENKLRIFELTCSKRDQFSKQLARSVFDAYHKEGSWATDEQGVFVECGKVVYRPRIFDVKLEDSNKPKWSFLKFVSENYFLKTQVVKVFNQEFYRNAKMSFYGKVISENHKIGYL